MMYCQTQAINAYCGKLAKLPALSDIEELKNHMMNETTNEVFAAMIKPAFAAIAGAGEFHTRLKFIVIGFIMVKNHLNLLQTI